MARPWKYSRKWSILVLILLSLSFAIYIFPAHAFVSFVQECDNSVLTSGSTITCAMSSNVSSGDELVAGFSYNLPATTHVSSVADSLSTSFSRRNTTLTAGSHPLNSSVWTGSASSSGADTLTVTFSVVGVSIVVAFAEFSGSINTVTKALSAMGTATSGGSYPLALSTNLNPSVGDLVYSYGSGDPCGGSGSITYSNSFTSSSANSITERSIGVCKTVGAVQFKLGQVDQYSAWPNTAVTTSPITWAYSTAIGVNTGEWSLIVLDLAATQITTTSTTTTTTTSTSTQDLSPKQGLSLLVMGGMILGFMLIAVMVVRSRR